MDRHSEIQGDEWRIIAFELSKELAINKIPDIQGLPFALLMKINMQIDDVWREVKELKESIK